MPVYNTELYLQRALDSVINQTYKNIELLCIDDASTDNSLSILKTYSSKDDRIKIIEFKENQGQGIARNHALKIATGDYIMFLDSDDTLELNACELAINQIIQNNNDFVFFNFKAFYPNNKVIQGDILKPLLREENNPHINPTKLKINMFHCLYVVMGIYQKDFILKNNIFFNTTRLCEDDIFYTKCWLNANDISIINQPLYNYYRRENSSSYQTIEYDKVLYAKRECYEECKKFYQNSYLMLNYVSYYISSLLYYIKKYSQLNRSIEKDFFYKIKNVFKELDRTENIDLIKDDINYIIFERMKNHSFFYYKLCMLVEKVFSIRRYSSNGKRNLVLRIFGKTYKFPICENRRIYMVDTKYARYLRLHGIYIKLKQKSYKEMYKHILEENNDLREEIEYLKSVISVNSLPVMTGIIREKQLKILDFTTKICSEFEKNGIEYFLDSGSAVGAIRHKGFIPWDDDIDIGMMRKDYTKCENYCKEHFIEIDISSLKIDNNFIKSKYNVLQQAFNKYPNKIFFIKSYNTLQIFCGLDLNDFVSVDIFSYDYYNDNYTFQEHLKYLDSFIFKVFASKNHGEAMNYINKELATNPNIVDKSNTIYFGIDSMTSFENNASHFYVAEKILPLVKTKFENVDLYATKDIDYYIANIIRDYKNWPPEIRMKQHLKTRANYVKNHCK